MINLIPPELKKRKGARSLTYIISLFYIIVVAALVLGLLGLTTLNFVQKASISDKQSQLDQLIAEKNKNKGVVSQAALIQNRVKNVANYQSAYDWNQILTEISAATPTDCQLSSLVVTSEAKKSPTITLTGTATDRRSIVLFEGKLNLNKHFSGASVTAISQVASTFNFTISLEVATASLPLK